MGSGSRAEVVVVGGGLAGLACARHLTRQGAAVRLLEAADAVGGRVRTDTVEGFRLDRGFQVLLTAYPEAQAQLDYAALDLRRFTPGARVFAEGGFSTVADPWRRPGAALESFFAPVGSIHDKLRVAALRHAVCAGPPERRYAKPETSARAYLEQRGFSPQMISRFFRPFFGGIFLDLDLGASSRMLEFLFRMFAEGHAAVPAEGMGRIAAQVEQAIPAGAIRLEARVTAVDGTRVTLASGETLAAAAVVLALPGPARAALLGRPARRRWRAVTNVYFAIDGNPPTSDPILHLDGAAEGPVTNLVFLSSVSPAYAPAGAGLASASVIGEAPQPDDVLESAIRRQLARWFGPETLSRWRHLRTYRITQALPDQSPPWYTAPRWPVRLGARQYRAGDTTDTASIDGALTSGRLAAEAVLEDLRG